MSFKKGDTVYYIDANDKVKRAIIKAVHRKDPEFPYELDIPSKNRFYPADCIFATAEAADNGVRIDQQQRLSDAIKSGKSVNLTQSSPQRKKLDRIFMLPEAQRVELDALCKALDDFCMEHGVPYTVSCIMGRKKSDKGEMELVRTASFFPGVRSADWMISLWEQQEDILGLED